MWELQVIMAWCGVSLAELLQLRVFSEVGGTGVCGRASQGLRGAEQAAHANAVGATLSPQDDAAPDHQGLRQPPTFSTTTLVRSLFPRAFSLPILPLHQPAGDISTVNHLSSSSGGTKGRGGNAEWCVCVCVCVCVRARRKIVRLHFLA